jgi:Flp pilus assembly protein TadG
MTMANPVSSRLTGTSTRTFLRRALTRLQPRRYRSESGQALVEFGFTFSMLMAFLIGMVQVSFAFYVHEAMSEMAREGTRYAIVRGSTCTTSGGSSCTATAAQIQNYVQGLGLLNNLTTVTATFPPNNSQVPGNGNYVKVVVTYTFPFNIPFVKNSSIAMSSTSKMQIIQ